VGLGDKSDGSIQTSSLSVMKRSSNKERGEVTLPMFITRERLNGTFVGKAVETMSQGRGPGAAKDGCDHNTLSKPGEGRSTSLPLTEGDFTKLEAPDS